MSTIGNVSTTGQAAVARLNHAVLYVADVERSVRFYGDVLGLEVAVRPPGMNAAFLRAPNTTNHHDLGLFGLGAGTGPATGRHTGLYHLAWQVATIDDLVEIRRRVLEVGAYVGESSHGATKSVYARDPDGVELEVMWMLPRDAWGTMADEATVEPLDLGAEAARWSGIVTA